eukprot:gene1809-2438_t
MFGPRWWVMNPRIFRLPLRLLVAGILALTGALMTARAAEADLPAIFNGQDLTGWKNAKANAFWRVEGGVLIGENDAKATGNMLWSERSYGDFVFECETRWTGEIDSGVMLRKPELQMQIGISRSLKRDMTGSFYTGGKPAYPEEGQAKTAGDFFKIGEWVKFRLEARGTTFAVFINGHPVAQYSNPKYAEPAAIGLQIHPGLKMKVEYRNLRLKELK